MDESNVLIKQMPMSVEAEQAVLGAIIIKPESFDNIGGMLTANDFYLEDHKRIYSTLMQMYGESKIIDTLDGEGIDIIVLAGFMSILSEKFTSTFENRIINVHPSLIPSFCGKGFYGLRVHEAALKYGVKVTGATVHYVNEIPDGGKIILQKSVAIKKGDTPEKLQRRVMEQAEWIILPKACELVSKDLLKKKKN